jgi:hypothetical protein
MAFNNPARKKWKETWRRQRILSGRRARYLDLCRKIGSFVQPLEEYSDSPEWAKDLGRA